MGDPFAALAQIKDVFRQAAKEVTEEVRRTEAHTPEVRAAPPLAAGRAIRRNNWEALRKILQTHQQWRKYFLLRGVHISLRDPAGWEIEFRNSLRQAAETRINDAIRTRAPATVIQNLKKQSSGCPASDASGWDV